MMAEFLVTQSLFLFAVAAPDRGGKEDQHRDDLETPDDHHKGEPKLGRDGEESEVLGRTDQPKARPDVVEAGHACRQVGQ